MNIKVTIHKATKTLVLALALALLGSCQVEKDIKDGIPAIAYVKQLQQGNKKITYGTVTYYQVIIDADIVTKEGKSWPVTFKEMAQLIDIPKIQPGQNVAVKYDPNDSTNICFDRNPNRKD
ncbi:MAG: hypothetical protein JST21_01710 [Bacteroidetes bacterium]|nr:hypothetical protein [Bacteroidota bacterium]MBS1744865.1 hypothetical protein [Bacteroidota bacterium]